MKIFTRILLLLLFLFPVFEVDAQVTIGTGTSIQRHPFNYYFGYGRDATIYTAAEMNTTATGGTLTTISWFSNLTSGWVTGPTVIYLKEVGSTTAVPLDTWANTISGATSVYTGTPTWANGWNSIDITDLSIAAGQNLMVLVECNVTGTGTGGSGGNSYRYTSSGTNTHGIWQQDNTAPTGNPTRDALRPNVILGGLTPPVPPANDNCAGALSLTVNPGLTCTTVTAGTTLAATQSQAACVGSGADDDVWFSFVATATSHPIEILNVSGSTDMAHQVFSGACGSLVSVVCSDPNTSTATGLTIGNTYYIRVHTYATSGNATFDVCVKTPPPPPANDNCAGAIALTVNPALTCTTVTSSTTAGATQSQAACVGSGADDDVWFSFVATATSHPIEILNVSGSTDMAHQVFSGACGSLVSVVCSDPNTSTATGLTIGNTYFIRVHTYFSAVNATFDVCVKTTPPPPANDACASATVIADGSTVMQDVSSATADATAPTCNLVSLSTQGVWFKFTAPANSSGTVTLSGCNSTYDMRIRVYTGTCAALTCLAGVAGGDDNDDCAGPGSGLAETHTFPVSAPAFHGGGGGAEAPVDYFVLITGAGGTLDFSISALLPLELNSFTGKTMPKTNMLNWETAQERDVNTHIVERSADGTTWTEIGRKAGQVQSTVATKYELEDRAPLAKAYYRLRSVDFDGKESVSASIVLTRKSEQFSITNVFPNPTDARVTVQFATKNEAPVMIRIVDLTGRIVLEQQTEVGAGINEIPVNLQSLATGVYNVTITNGTETAGPVRIVKGE